MGVREGVPIPAREQKRWPAMAQSLAELRNLYGTGHGKDGKSKGLAARHAKLAVGAAATVAVFLFETHKDRP